ncbi:MAG: DUF421 domain-containing protein [Firmicutes bacterium HGW-Firmicutes-15]|nr:MAG: DUF421 domain-containing protein [Firmicutes bacterium HGW-Firmicutes-15]
MGKKQISQLTFFDYIVGITIGSIAASLSIDDHITYTHGLIGLVVWGSFPIIIAYLNLKNMRARRLLGGVSTIVIQNGTIVEANLRKERLHINDLLEELRIKGAFNIDDVESAILETNGQISVQMKADKQAVTPSDLNIAVRQQGLSANLIIDGKVMPDNLTLMGLSYEWLIGELKKSNINSPRQVMLACLNSSRDLHIYLKNQDIKTLTVID